MTDEKVSVRYMVDDVDQSRRFLHERVPASSLAKQHRRHSPR